jgi:hypothetical protein
LAVPTVGVDARAGERTPSPSPAAPAILATNERRDELPKTKPHEDWMFRYTQHVKQCRALA